MIATTNAKEANQKGWTRRNEQSHSSDKSQWYDFESARRQLSYLAFAIPLARLLFARLSLGLRGQRRVRSLDLLVVRRATRRAPRADILHNVVPAPEADLGGARRGRAETSEPGRRRRIGPMQF